MTVVARVLLDHVDEDPWKAGRVTGGPGAPGELVESAAGLCLRDQHTRLRDGVLPERQELIG